MAYLHKDVCKYQERVYTHKVGEILSIILFIQKSLGVWGGNPPNTAIIRSGFSAILVRIKTLQATAHLNPIFNKHLSHISDWIGCINSYMSEANIDNLSEFQFKLNVAIRQWVEVLGSIDYWKVGAAEARAFRVSEYRSVWELDESVEFKYSRPRWWLGFYRPSPIRPNTKLFWKKFYKLKWDGNRQNFLNFRPNVGSTSVGFYRRVGGSSRKVLVLACYYNQINKKPLHPNSKKVSVAGADWLEFLAPSRLTYRKKVHRRVTKMVKKWRLYVRKRRYKFRRLVGEFKNPSIGLLVFLGVGAYLERRLATRGRNRGLNKKYCAWRLKKKRRFRGLKRFKTKTPKIKFSKTSFIRIARFRTTRPVLTTNMYGHLPITIYEMFRRKKPWVFRPHNQAGTGSEAYGFSRVIFRGVGVEAVKNRIHFEKRKQRRWALRRRFSTFRTPFKVPSKVFGHSVGYFRYRFGRVLKFCRVFLAKPTSCVSLRLSQAAAQWGESDMCFFERKLVASRQQTSAGWISFLKNRTRRRRRWSRPTIKQYLRRAYRRQSKYINFFSIRVPSGLWWHKRHRRPRFWYTFSKRKPQKSRKLLFRSRVLLRRNRPWRFRRIITSKLAVVRSPVSGFWWVQASAWPFRRRRLNLAEIRAKQLRIKKRRNNRRLLALFWLGSRYTAKPCRVFWFWFKRLRTRRYFENSFIWLHPPKKSQRDPRAVFTTYFVWRRWSRFGVAK